MSSVRDRLKAGFKEDDIRTLSNRRVYFLAVNHTNEYLQNQHLRKALAHAKQARQMRAELSEAVAALFEQAPVALPERIDSAHRSNSDARER